jgi:hypothetical protein
MMSPAYKLDGQVAQTLVPEPGSLLLAALAATGLTAVVIRRRRKR